MCRIVNKRLIEEYYGYFPTFHDAEIRKVELDREIPSAIITMLDYSRDEMREAKNPSVEIVVRILNITEIELRDFNYQNVLTSIVITEEENKINISINSVFGLSGRIVADRIEFLRVEDRR